MIDWGAVEIGEEHVAALRLLLQDGPQAWEQLHKQEMTTDQGAAPYLQMFQAAFGVAVRRRFPSSYTVHDIVRYVAKLRVELKEHDDDDIDPRTAENAIRTALGDPSLRDDDKTDGIEDVTKLEQLIAAQVLIVFDVVYSDGESEEDGLEGFVREAAEVARRWVRERQAAQAEESAH